VARAPRYTALTHLRLCNMSMPPESDPTPVNWSRIGDMSLCGLRSLELHSLELHDSITDRELAEIAGKQPGLEVYFVFLVFTTV
jgi:hypothetical protein